MLRRAIGELIMCPKQIIQDGPFIPTSSCAKDSRKRLADALGLFSWL